MFLLVPAIVLMVLGATLWALYLNWDTEEHDNKRFALVAGIVYALFSALMMTLWLVAPSHGTFPTGRDFAIGLWAFMSLVMLVLMIQNVTRLSKAHGHI